MENGTIVRALSLAVAGGAAHDPWITTLTAALEGVGATEASWKPNRVERSIWEVTLHARQWTDWAVGLLAGRDTDVVTWPEVTDRSTEAWESEMATLRASLAAFQAAVDALNDDQLLESPIPAVTPTNRITGILSIAVHNAHHAGQITKLREAYIRRG